MLQKVGLTPFCIFCTLYACRKKVNRWLVLLVGNFVDVGAATCVEWIAKYPAWKSSEGRRKRRVFLLELGHKLVLPNIKLRDPASILRDSV